MFRPTTKEITKIVKDHENWRLGRLGQGKGKRAKFSNMDLCSRELVGIDLAGADFVNCNLTNANFRDSNLDSCLFDKCLLKNAIFQYTDFFAVRGFDGSFSDAFFDQTVVYETSRANVFLCSYSPDRPTTIHNIGNGRVKESYMFNLDDYFRIFGTTQ